jgi:hypothetical protein
MAAPELVRDVDQVDALLEVMVANGSRALSFSGIGRDESGRLDRSQLEPAVEHGFCIVRWVPVDD